MSSYVESHLGTNEVVIKKAERNGLFLVGTWIKGILLCWLLLIPTVKAIMATVSFFKVELAITSKRVVGRVGVLKTKSLDCPLNKVQTVGVSQKFLGKIFNYCTIDLTTAAGSFTIGCIKNGEAFKGMIMAQIEQYEQDHIAEQAKQMASAMAGAIKNN